MQLSVLDDIQAKLASLASHLRCVGTEQLHVDQSSGRILAQDVLNFRDSPPMDVSAMDGYAFRLSDLQSLAAESGSDDLEIDVTHVAIAGAQPLGLSVGKAIRIFTGAVVPQGADVVIPRERCKERSHSVVIEMPIDQIKLGWNIRKQGENARQGDLALPAGYLIDGPRISSLVSMSHQPQIEAYRKVQVTVINTGDELLSISDPIQPWQIRDSNGPLLESMLESCPWIQWTRTSVRDDLEGIRHAIAQALSVSDAIILTGGVSMGDTDHVPAAVRQCGAEIRFHRMAIRPGAPILGATTTTGQLILGLPGNPVSVAVTFKRFGLPFLEQVAGRIRSRKPLKVELANPDRKTLHLVWYRLVEIQSDGRAVLIPNQGSGDIRSLGLCDGFIEIPAHSASEGLFPFYDWSCS